MVYVIAKMTKTQSANMNSFEKLWFNKPIQWRSIQKTFNIEDLELIISVAYPER